MLVSQQIVEMRTNSLRAQKAVDRLKTTLGEIDRTSMPEGLASFFQTLEESQDAMSDFFKTQIDGFDRMLSSQDLDS